MPTMKNKPRRETWQRRPHIHAHMTQKGRSKTRILDTGARENSTTKWEKTVNNSFKQMNIQKQTLGLAKKTSLVTLARTFCCSSSQNVIPVK